MDGNIIPGNGLNGYELSRKWFDWCFDNTSKIRPVHSALFFFVIEQNNRLGWKKEFGLPRSMAMDAIGVKNNRTFSAAFNDLEDWGFITVIERSKNQFSANIISLFGCVKNTPATTKALDKATQKQSQKQRMGIAPIIKPLTNKLKTNKPIEERKADFKKSLSPYLVKYRKDLLNDFYKYWTEKNMGGLKLRFEKEKTFELSRRLEKWKANDEKWNKKQGQDIKSEVNASVIAKLEKM